MKGQRSLELLGSFGLIFVVMIATISYSLGDIPAIAQETEETEKYVETRYATDRLLAEEGYLDLSANTLNQDISDEISQYTNFEHSVRIVEFKVLNLENSFIRGDPPSSIITEPNYREDIENEVKYGTDIIEGEPSQFIVTAKDGEFDRLYRRDSSGFWSSYSEGDIIDNWNVDEFQNRPPNEGHSVFLRRSLVDDFDRKGDNSIKMNRYGYVDDRVVRLEVLSW